MKRRLALSLPIFLALLAASLPNRALARGHRDVEGVVNINTASEDELRLLPGIGPAKVRSILAYRRQHPFRTVEELVRIKGIGRKMVRRLRLHLAVTGETTARQVVAPDPGS
jgi:competence ComEA-like helix-hairpin-helix protein